SAPEVGDGQGFPFGLLGNPVLAEAQPGPRQLLECHERNTANGTRPALALFEHFAAKWARDESHCRQLSLRGLDCLPMPRPTRLDNSAVDAFLAQHRGWERAETGAIAKRYKFPDFPSALAFAVRVGCYAEKQDHHPDV